MLSMYLEFRSDFHFVKLNQNCWNLNEILDILGYIESTKKADHILEITGLGVFCNYYLLNFTS